MSMESAKQILATMPTPEQKIAAVTQPAPATKAENGSQQQAAAVSSPGSEQGGVGAPPAETKKDDKLSAQFGALAKREKGLVRQQQDLKAKEAAIAAKEAALAEREAKAKAAEAMWDTDIFKSLEMRGLDYNTLTKRYLEGQTAPPKKEIDPETAAKNVISEFEARQAEKEAAKEAAAKKAQEESAAKQEEEYKAAYQNFRAEVGDFIKNNDAEYELTALYDQTDLVVDTVQGYFDEHNKVLSIKEACELVEKYMEDLASKAAKAKKMSKYFTATEEGEKKPEAGATQVARKTGESPKTLSNNLTPTMSSNLPAKSEQDRMKRALAQLK